MAKRVSPPPGEGTGPEAVASTAVLLRRLLDVVESGELEADGWQGAAIRHRLEGAVIVLEQLDNPPV